MRPHPRPGTALWRAVHPRRFCRKCIGNQSWRDGNSVKKILCSGVDRARGELGQTRPAFAALQFGKHLLRCEAVLGQGDQAVEPQVGGLVQNFLRLAILGRHDEFGSFFADFFQNGVFALVKQPRHIRSARVGPFAADNGGVDARERRAGIGGPGRVNLPMRGRAVIDLCRVFQYRIRHLPMAVIEAVEKTGLAPGVAGDAARLLHLQQHHVAVAIEADIAHGLHMAGLFALVPQLVARARPIHRFAALVRQLQRLAVHPGEHEHAAGVRVLRDGGHEPAGIPFDLIEPVHGMDFRRSTPALAQQFAQDAHSARSGRMAMPRAARYCLACPTVYSP